jgi:hypothetical protein
MRVPVDPWRLFPACAGLLLLVAVAGGCAGPEQEDGGRPPRDTSGVARGAWQPGEEWRLVEQAEIGSGRAGDSITFSRIVDVAIDGLGRVWAADGDLNVIRVFEADGRQVRSFGREGAGPGEFLGIAGMDWAPDGTLWVLDGGNMRFAVYDTAGNYVATHRRSSNVVTAPWPLGFDRRGRLYDQGSAGYGNAQETVVRFGPGLQPQDSFSIPAFDDPGFEIEMRQGGDRRIERVTVPYAGLQEWGVDPEGFVWIGITDRYRLERHRFDGRVDRVVEREVAPSRVTAEDRRRARSGLQNFERKGGRIDASRIPETHTVFTGFFFGEEGDLWVLRTAKVGERAVLDVFDSAGAYQGTVRGPVRLTHSPAPVIRGGRMAAVVQDDDQVESIVVLRVEKPGK